MSLLKYLWRKDELPEPKGLLLIPSRMIASANKEVQKVLTMSVSKKRGPYSLPKVSNVGKCSNYKRQQFTAGAHR